MIVLYLDFLGKAATFDPSRLVFKFMGKDQAGVTIDENADQYDGFSGEMF